MDKKRVLRDIPTSAYPTVRMQTRTAPLPNGMMAYIVEDTSGVEPQIATIAPKGLSAKQFFDLLNGGHVNRKKFNSLPADIRTPKKVFVG
jgi:hypothetical protein